jgi:hypothetical protein
MKSVRLNVHRSLVHTLLTAQGPDLSVLNVLHIRTNGPLETIRLSTPVGTDWTVAPGSSVCHLPCQSTNADEQRSVGHLSPRNHTRCCRHTRCLMLETTTTTLLEKIAVSAMLARDVLRRMMIHTPTGTLQMRATRTIPAMANLTLGLRRHDAGLNTTSQNRFKNYVLQLAGPIRKYT